MSSNGVAATVSLSVTSSRGSSSVGVAAHGRLSHRPGNEFEGQLKGGNGIRRVAELSQHTRLGRQSLARSAILRYRYRYRMDLDCAEPIVGWVGRCGVLVSPHNRLARIPGMGWLGMLLASIEPIQVMHRHDCCQHEVPDLADEVAGGAAGIGAIDVAARDR